MEWEQKRRVPRDSALVSLMELSERYTMRKGASCINAEFRKPLVYLLSSNIKLSRKRCLAGIEDLLARCDPRESDSETKSV